MEAKQIARQALIDPSNRIHEISMVRIENESGDAQYYELAVIVDDVFVDDPVVYSREDVGTDAEARKRFLQFLERYTKQWTKEGVYSVTIYPAYRAKQRTKWERKTYKTLKSALELAGWYDNDDNGAVVWAGLMKVATFGTKKDSRQREG